MSRGNMDFTPWVPQVCLRAGTTSSRTYVIFNTDAYLKVYPYCKAILHCDSLKEDEHFEDVRMLVLAVVFAELCQIANDQKLPIAIASRNLIDEALRCQSPRLEAQVLTHNHQVFASLPERHKEHVILEQAYLTKELGGRVIVVTDEAPLQLYLGQRGLLTLSVAGFLARFHWLTPLVIANVGDDLKFIGQAESARFAETVVVSVLWRAVIAQLAPMSMEVRLMLFPAKKLDAVLTHLLKHRAIVSLRTGPFATLNYAQVKTTLGHLGGLLRTYPNNFQSFVPLLSFLDSAVILCRPIADFFINMKSRVDLIESIADAYRSRLDRNKLKAISPPRADRYAHNLQEVSLQKDPTEKAPSLPADECCSEVKTSVSAWPIPTDRCILGKSDCRKRIRFTRPLCVGVVGSSRRTRKTVGVQDVLTFGRADNARHLSYGLRSKTRCKAYVCSACTE